MGCENEKYIFCVEILLSVILQLQQTTLQRLTTAPCDEHRYYEDVLWVAGYLANFSRYLVDLFLSVSDHSGSGFNN